MDFDNTLFSHRIGQIPPSAIKAIKKLNENNIKVFLCSGRAFCEMELFDLSQIKIDGMILSNGQVAYDQNNQKIYENEITDELKEKIIKIFNDKRMPIYVVTQDGPILNFENDTIRRIQAAITSDVPPVKEYNGEQFFVASVFYNTEAEKEELLQLRDIAEVTSWFEGAFDIVPLGTTKIEGIKNVNKIYGIDLSETLAIGDGENDIDMLKDCGIGIAMGNSPDYVKQTADYITNDIDDDGIYNGLKHYQLI